MDRVWSSYQLQFFIHTSYAVVNLLQLFKELFSRLKIVAQSLERTHVVGSLVKTFVVHL